jgi:hypothetical protein
VWRTVILHTKVRVYFIHKEPYLNLNKLGDVIAALKISFASNIHFNEELAACLNMFSFVTLNVGYILCAFIVRIWLLCRTVICNVKDLETEQIC